MTTYQLDALRVPCPVCGAAIGALCETQEPVKIHVQRAIRGDYSTLLRTR